jgi:hypothetical protein
MAAPVYLIARHGADNLASYGDAFPISLQCHFNSHLLRGNDRLEEALSFALARSGQR